MREILFVAGEVSGDLHAAGVARALKARNAPFKLTAVGGVSNSHDARGNVSAIGTNSYGYSSENMLISAPSSTTLAYDPLNRVYQTVGGGTTTRFGYDGGQIAPDDTADVNKV